MFQIVVLVGLTAWAIVQNLLYMNFLPDRVAIHFGANGVANNWLDRGQATLMMIAIQCLLPWFLVATAYLVRYLPISLINVPHREYWLVGERRESSLAYLASLLAWIAVAESVLFSAVNHLSFNANRTGQPLNTPMFLVALFIFMGATIVLLVKMYRRFALPTSVHPGVN